MPRSAILAIAVLAACSSKEDLSEIRAELTDLRAEQRTQRQEVRELRDALRKLEATGAPPPAAADAGPATAAPPTPEPPAATGSPPAAAKAATGKPPAAQGSVNIQVESNPAGAAVFVAEKKVGVTPVIIKAAVGSDEIRVRLEKAGYRPRLMTLRPEEDTKISVQLAKKSE